MLKKGMMIILLFHQLKSETDILLAESRHLPFAVLLIAMVRATNVLSTVLMVLGQT
jgi:hypothetical protein